LWLLNGIKEQLVIYFVSFDGLRCFFWMPSLEQVLKLDVTEGDEDEIEDENFSEGSASSSS
jgi:hypothetical protein